MEKNDVFEWIKRIIETCNVTFHFEAVDRLIELYQEKYGYDNTVLELQLLRTEKFNQVHTILT